MTATSRLLLAAALAASAAAGAATDCPEGEPVQWAADYCMLTMETDDEIAISDCLEAQRQVSFPGDCARKLHHKKRMCEIMVRSGTRDGTVEDCVGDVRFKGPVVERGGVGG